MDRWAAAAHREGRNANLDAARQIRDDTRALLTTVRHAPETKTPSPEGAPPAAISGRLAASVRATRDGDDAVVGPTDAARSKNGPYGRFLELGGDHEAHNSTGYMWWREDGKRYRAAFIRKIPRPYLKPATEAAISSGRLTAIYVRHWLAAQQRAAS